MLKRGRKARAAQSARRSSELYKSLKKRNLLQGAAARLRGILTEERGCRSRGGWGQANRVRASSCSASFPFSEEGLKSPFAWPAGMSFHVTGRWIPVAQVRNDESRQEAGPGAGCISPCPVLAAQAALRPFLWDLLFLDRSRKQDSADSVQVRSEEEGDAANLLESGAVGLQIDCRLGKILPFIPVSAEGAFPHAGTL